MNNIKKFITFFLIIAILSLAGGVAVFFFMNDKTAGATTLNGKMAKTEFAEAVSKINSWTIVIYNDWYSERETDGEPYVEDWQNTLKLYYNETEKLAYVTEDFTVRDKDVDRKGDYAKHKGFWTENRYYGLSDYHFKEYTGTSDWEIGDYGGKDISWFNTLSGENCEGYEENGVTIRAMNCIKHAFKTDFDNVVLTSDGYYLYRGIYPFEGIDNEEYWYELRFKVNGDGKIEFTMTTVEYEYVLNHLAEYGYKTFEFEMSGTIYDFNKTSVQAYYDEFSEEFERAEATSTLAKR